MQRLRHQRINNEDAVKLRVHRRSVEQKTKRTNAFWQGRPGIENLDPLPLDAVVEEEPAPAENVPTVAISDARRDMLKRWKARKELQARLKKQPFRITKIQHSQPIFLFSEKDVNGDVFRPTSSNTRVTRSMANLGMAKGAAVNESRIPLPMPTKATRQAAHEPAAKLARAIPPKSKLPVTTKNRGKQLPKPTSKPKNKTNSAAASSSEVQPSVPRSQPNRASFAPEQFVFTAPAGVIQHPVGLSAAVIDQLLPSILSSERSPDKPKSEAQSLGNPKIMLDSLMPGVLPNEEAFFKTPSSTTNGNPEPLKISPLIINNPWICTTRGLSSSAHKKNMKSRISEPRTPAGDCMDFHAAEATPKVDEKVQITKEKSVLEIKPESQNFVRATRQLRRRTLVSVDENVTRSSTGVALTTGYFRGILENQTDRLKSLCQTWNSTMESEKTNLSENVAGRIRATIGLAELLMAERFKQFSSLIDDCELGRGEKATTCVDLQGFWEMIYTQVEDVDNKFQVLGKIQNNSWTEIETPVKKSAAALRKRAPVTRAVKGKTNVGKSDNYQAARQRLADAKAKAKAIRQQEVVSGSPEVQISTSGDGRILRSHMPLTQALLPCNENVTTPKRNSAEKVLKTPSGRRVSLRRSVLTENLDKMPNSPALLVPLPVLEKLSLSSPVDVQNPTMRLSELFSPLAAERRRMVPTLDTIRDEDNAMLTDERTPVQGNCSPARKRTTRSSNLIRFSEIFPKIPADVKISEKENIDLTN